jgi:hypothetical protein
MAFSKEPILITITITGETSSYLPLVTLLSFPRWKPFDPSRNWPDLGERFPDSRKMAENVTHSEYVDRRDLDWSAVMKRTFESYIRGEIPNMYGEWLKW